MGGEFEGRVVEFTVLDAEIKPGRCLDGADAFGDVCHRLKVRVDNTGYNNRLATGKLVWSAEDDDLTEHDFGDGSKDDIAPDAVEELYVIFTLDDGPTRLQTLIYERFGARGEANIPPY